MVSMSHPRPWFTVGGRDPVDRGCLANEVGPRYGPCLRKDPDPAWVITAWKSALRIADYAVASILKPAVGTLTLHGPAFFTLPDRRPEL